LKELSEQIARPHLKVEIMAATATQRGQDDVPLLNGICNKQRKGMNECLLLGDQESL
jgi:hypothetical protein